MITGNLDCALARIANVALVAVPLLIDISVAIVTTKWPMLRHQGFWSAMHESRVDLCMFFGLVAILLLGPGSFSVDSR